MNTRKTTTGSLTVRTRAAKAAARKAAARTGTGVTVVVDSGPPVEPAAVKALRRVMARKGHGRAGIQAVVYTPGETEVQVLGAQPAGKGRIYQVLAPTTQPRHLSSEDIQALVNQMVTQKGTAG